MSDSDQEKADRALLDVIFNKPWHELVHETDCFACDIAFEVSGVVAAHWDKLDIWDKLPAYDGLDEDTLYRQLERMAASVLHRRLPGHRPAPGRPAVSRG